MKLLPIYEGMFGKSAESKKNEKIAAMLQKRFGGSYPFMEIADLQTLWQRTFVQTENEYFTTFDTDYDTFDNRYMESQEFLDILEKNNQVIIKQYGVDYTLKFEYRGGEYLVTYTLPISGPGGRTLENLINQLNGWFQYFSIEDYTIRCVSFENKRSRKPYKYDIHVNGDDIHFPMNREEKKRQPYDPSKSIDPETGRPIR